ncbi:MAG: glucosaminidase domain-containing protein, partial [Rhodospirillaceae bacterium]
MIKKALHSVSRKLRHWFPDREIEYEAIILAFVVGGTALLLFSPAPPTQWTVSPYTTAEWAAIVERYQLMPGEGEEVPDEVPRIYLNAFPADWPAELSVSERKRLFAAALLPLVLAENEDISAERERMLPLLDKMDVDEPLSWREERYLRSLAVDYGLEDFSARDLRARVAPVPISLALAQGAIESGWGTSRFARDGNAVFGQWVWNEDRGIVPSARREGATHAVREFRSLADSVRAYARNLNTHRAYRAFRQQRAAQLSDDEVEAAALSGMQLAATMIRYSERGEKYVR